MGLKTSAVQTEGAVQLEWTLADTSYPFVAVTAATDARLAMEEMAPRTDGTYVEYFAVDGEDPRTILGAATAHDGSTTRVLSASDDGGLIEIEVESDCPAMTLADQGAIPREIRSEDGVGRIVADVPDVVDASAVVETFVESYPSADLRARRQHDADDMLFNGDGIDDGVEDTLSERQREALEAAHAAGYYEWPRDVTAEEVAADLDISPPTFHQHRRAAERKVIDILVDASSPSVDGSAWSP